MISEVVNLFIFNYSGYYKPKKKRERTEGNFLLEMTFWMQPIYHIVFTHCAIFMHATFLRIR